MQVATILSIDPLVGYVNSWTLEISYTLDAGGIGTTQFAVGSLNQGQSGGPSFASSGWASATSNISVTVPGCAAQVLVACPPQVQFAQFGVASKGIPLGA